MVLESLISPPGAIKRPGLVFVLGFIYATIGFFLSMWVFREYASLVMVFLTVFALIPLFVQFMNAEEVIGLVLRSEKLVLRQHARTLLTFVALFVGMSAAFSLWYIFFPSPHQAFSVQAQTIASLANTVTGNAASPDLFVIILLNNLKVLMFCILFSFLYGAGAIFILTWNASVIGVALGNFVTQGASHAVSTGSGPVVAYVTATGMSMARYLIHGIPEITGYFIGGLAGGVLSAAIIKRHWHREQMDKVLLDASDLIILAAVVLFVAAAIETFITPLLV